MPECVIHVLNGPNLNLLGAREPEIYGSETLGDIESGLRSLPSADGVEVTFRQSNSEGELVGWIQEFLNAPVPTGLIINPGAYTHTSVAIRDALGAVKVPFIEVHLSNVHARESFRHHSYLSPLAKGVICGLGSDGYKMAFESLVKQLTSAT